MTMSWSEAVGFTPPVDNPVTLVDETVFLNAFDFYSSPMLDLRGYQSIMVRVSLEGGTALATDPWSVDLTYYASPTASGANAVYLDSYEVFAAMNAADVHNRPLLITDTVHGPFMQIDIGEALSPGRTGNAIVRVIGSYRPLPNLFVRQYTSAVVQGVLYDARHIALGAGAAITENAFFGYGPARAFLYTAAAGGARMDIKYGSEFPLDRVVVAAANSFTGSQIVVPRKQMRVTITNTAAAAQDVVAMINQQLTPI